MKTLLLALALISATISAQDLKWTLPDTWELSPKKSAMRLATFTIKDNADLEISVSRFPGDVGGDLANVNRWRRQIGLAPVAAPDLQKEFELIESKAGKAKLVDISNADKQMLAVIFPLKGNTYFFKLNGKKDTVSKQKDSMIKLIKSLTSE